MLTMQNGILESLRIQNDSLKTHAQAIVSCINLINSMEREIAKKNNILIGANTSGGNEKNPINLDSSDDDSEDEDYVHHEGDGDDDSELVADEKITPNETNNSKNNDDENNNGDKNDDENKNGENNDDENNDTDNNDDENNDTENNDDGNNDDENNEDDLEVSIGDDEIADGDGDNEKEKK